MPLHNTDELLKRLQQESLEQQVQQRQNFETSSASAQHWALKTLYNANPDKIFDKLQVVVEWSIGIND